MIERPDGLSRHYTDTRLSQYHCGEYSALAAWWITQQGLNNGAAVYIVTLIGKNWNHTVCEVRNCGTFDGKINAFLPGYYYHKGPATHDQFWSAKRAFNWLDYQKLDETTEELYLYSPDEIISTNLVLLGDHLTFHER